MPIWKHNGIGWEKAPFYNKNNLNVAFLFCPGPSLNLIDNVPALKQMQRGIVRFGINTSYPKVKPDLWIGMDPPDCYDANLWHEPFPKIARGGLQEQVTYDGKPMFMFPNTYIADVQKPTSGDGIFDNIGPETRYIWNKNTMAVAIHIIANMGFKKIFMLGVDMGGLKDYYDDRRLSAYQRKRNRQLYSEQVAWMQNVVRNAKKLNIKFYSCTPKSPLNGFVDYLKLEDAVRLSMGEMIRKPVLHSTEAYSKRSKKNKIGVVVPTKNRPDYLDKAMKMIRMQTIQPDHIQVIGYDSPYQGCDITWRYKMGFEALFKKGCELVFMWEDDDYYVPTYIEQMLEEYKKNNSPAIFGTAYSLYYHLATLQYDIQDHPGRSSAYNTVVTKQVLDIPWPTGDYKFLDLHLWKYMKGKTFRPKQALSIGIKHGEGLTAGAGHDPNRMQYTQVDKGMELLDTIVQSEEIMDFYRGKHKKLSYNKNVLFFHMPKTGGVAMQKALEKTGATFYGHNLNRDGFIELPVYLNQHKGFRSFCFVRDPRDRFLSAFNYLKTGGRTEGDKKDAEKFIGRIKHFNSFVEKHIDNPELFKQIHFRPQYEWICNATGNIVVDHVAKFEDLKSEWREALGRMNLPIVFLSKMNASKHDDWKKAYNKKTFEKVTNAYKKDIEMFGYEDIELEG